MSLRLSKTDRVLGGVLGGLAQALQVDSSVLRWVFAACVIFGVGTPIIAYLAVWFVMILIEKFGKKDAE